MPRPCRKISDPDKMFGNTEKCTRTCADWFVRVRGCLSVCIHWETVNCSIMFGDLSFGSGQPTPFATGDTAQLGHRQEGFLSAIEIPQHIWVTQVANHPFCPFGHVTCNARTHHVFPAKLLADASSFLFLSGLGDRCSWLVFLDDG